MVASHPRLRISEFQKSRHSWESLGTCALFALKPYILVGRKLARPQKEELAEQSRPCPDPVASCYPPPSHFGAVTERLEQLMADYLKEKNRPLEPTCKKSKIVQNGCEC
jgi:hypothetical protein